MLASNVPNTGKEVTVLPSAKSSATTTVGQVDEGVDALVLTADQTGDGTWKETLWTEGDAAGTVVAFLVIAVTTALPCGGRRWSRMFGGSGRMGTTKEATIPIPISRALGRRGIGLGRDTAAQSKMPPPVVGAGDVGGWGGLTV